MVKMRYVEKLKERGITNMQSLKKSGRYAVRDQYHEPSFSCQHLSITCKRMVAEYWFVRYCKWPACNPLNSVNGLLKLISKYNIYVKAVSRP